MLGIVGSGVKGLSGESGDCSLGVLKMLAGIVVLTVGFGAGPSLVVADHLWSILRGTIRSGNTRLCTSGTALLLIKVSENMKHVHIAELNRNGGAVFGGRHFETPWSVFDYWALEPRDVRKVLGDGAMCEQGFVYMGGAVEVTAGPFRERSESGSGFIIGPVGRECALENITDRVVGAFHVCVELDEAQMQEAGRDPIVNVGAFDRAALKWRDAIHGGSGQIATRHVLKPEDFRSSWTFLDHAILSAGGSVGYHYHDALEESFVVTAGEGLMTIDNETFAVGQGSVTWQGIGQGHGIYNPGPEELEFVRIAVAQRDEQYTTIDLHDDLSSRGLT